MLKKTGKHNLNTQYLTYNPQHTTHNIQPTTENRQQKI